MTDYYNAGKAGKPFDLVEDSGMVRIPIEAKQAAFEAGKADGTAQNANVPLAENPNQNYNKDVKYKNVDTQKIGLQFFASKEKQFGKKVGKHAIDFGLNPSNANDRNKFQSIINNILENSEEVRIGFWRGQTQDVLFHILGEDVVITTQDNEFISILKGGINNGRVKNARIK